MQYYWVTAQSEYATDVIFQSRQALRDLYPRLLSHGLLCLGAKDVMGFLGRPLRSTFQGEITTDFLEMSHLRIPGTTPATCCPAGSTWRASRRPRGWSRGRSRWPGSRDPELRRVYLVQYRNRSCFRPRRLQPSPTPRCGFLAAVPGSKSRERRPSGTSSRPVKWSRTDKACAERAPSLAGCSSPPVIALQSSGQFSRRTE